MSRVSLLFGLSLGTLAMSAPAALAESPPAAPALSTPAAVVHAESVQAVCPPAPLGHAQCAAEVLVWRASGALVRPHPADRRSALTIVADRRRRAAPSSALAQSPPQPGTPAYLQQAYDLTYLSATQGSGRTVAIVDAFGYPAAASDLATFRSANGLPPCTVASGCLQIVGENGASSPLPPPQASWEVEQATDLDAVSALCPNCRIVLVEASSTAWGDLVAAIRTAAAMGATQISNSWTTVAANPPASSLSFPGVSLVAASGDNGYVGTSGDSYPAAYPGVLAAGGTSLQPASNPRGFSETAWSGAGSGCDTKIAKPAFQGSIGCSGRAYADLSADADPHTGLGVYDSSDGGWLLAGGTSLASPLIAAYEAISGLGGTSPGWAYANGGSLNQPLSGSNGSCPVLQTFLCEAGGGYGGPTGTGSISGALVSGAPGIGGPGQNGANGPSYVQSVTGSSATLAGGVYANRADTTYTWDYGTTSAYGQSTPPVDIGSGQAPVPATGTLSGLVPSTLYHYRLAATNSLGTSYGYDYTFTTPGGAPVNMVAPRVLGDPRPAQPLSASIGQWTAVGTTSFAWELERGGVWSPIPGAASGTFVPSAAQVGLLVRVRVTETTPSGQASATSAPSRVEPAAPHPDRALGPALRRHRRRRRR